MKKFPTGPPKKNVCNHFHLIESAENSSVRIGGLFQECIVQLCVSRPDNPISFLREYFQKLERVSSKSSYHTWWLRPESYCIVFLYSSFFCLFYLLLFWFSKPLFINLVLFILTIPVNFGCGKGGGGEVKRFTAGHHSTFVTIVLRN